MGNPSQRQGCQLGADLPLQGPQRPPEAAKPWEWDGLEMDGRGSPMRSGLASAPGQKPSCAPLGRSPEHRWLCDKVEIKAFSPAINHEVLAAALDFPSRLAGGDLGAHDSPG